MIPIRQDALKLVMPDGCSVRQRLVNIFTLASIRGHYSSMNEFHERIAEVQEFVDSKGFSFTVAELTQNL